ncbi:hypothetical protein [Streptomyces gardneri]|uniref:hypothetical protein n=1 Tax=Streptomyces gardneri TaxID=66892 RepID=UPI0035D609D6
MIEPEHVCRPGASVYYCPTIGELESDCHGGFDTCCSHPDLHRVLDPQRRYLVPVARLGLPDEPDVVHLSLFQWVPAFETWATGMALCGHSTKQGPLPEATAVTCSGCTGLRADYERFIAPGYNPAEDDPRALQARIAAALELHRPERVEYADGEMVEYCSTCHDRGGGRVLSPCSTIQALTVGASS